MIAAVVLAAGAASRMGRTKQLLPLAGKPLVRHVAAAACAAAVGEVVVVTGAESAAVAAAVAGLPLRTVYNADWPAGQSASLKTGLAALAPEARAVVFLLADQPLVTPELINALIDSYRQGGATIAVPVAGGRRGNPVLFDLARWRSALMDLAGDAGARGIIDANPGEVAQIEAGPEIFLDIDTPDDYTKMQAIWNGR
jgi:molybdenum cofactor cytidylyltransferase